MTDLTQTQQGIDTRLMLAQAQYTEAQNAYIANPNSDTKRALYAASAKLQSVREAAKERAIQAAYESWGQS